MPRYSSNGLWRDRYWRRTPSEVKTVYLYLWDACDIAGFWDIDYDELALYCHIPTDERAGMFDTDCHTAESAVRQLAPRYLMVKGDVAWLRGFLDAQCSLPLNPNNPFHRGILKRIASHPEMQPKILSEIDCNQSPTEAPPKGVGIVRNSKGISKVVRNSKEKAESVAAAGVNAEAVDAIIQQWNTKARKKASASEALALEMVVRQVLDIGTDIAWSDIGGAIDNYHQAAAVPGTRAGNFRLTNFIRRLPEDGKCYLPDFFDIDNYKQDGQQQGLSTAERLAAQKGPEPEALK